MTLKTKRRAEDFEELLAVSREELLRRGALSVLTERIWQLRERVHQLAERHGSLAALERRLKAEGVPPDDHSLYHDWLEWRAAQHELDRLLEALKTTM
jgi:hypothetical protein